MKEDLHISSDGYIPINDILKHRSLRGKCTLQEIEYIVATNNKQRFTLRKKENGEFEIRANQGHSIVSIL